MTSSNSNEEKGDERNLYFAPGLVDLAIREAMIVCWRILPVESRNIPRLADEMRRILERAIKDNLNDEGEFS